MEKQSNGFLKVTGILLIIGGSVSIIVGLLAVACSSVLVAADVALDAGAGTGLLMVASILILVSGVVSLIAGIVGVKNAAKPEKAGSCIVWGVLVIVLAVLGNILTMVAGGPLNYISIVTGLVLPALYLLGAFQNKKRAA